MGFLNLDIAVIPGQQQPPDAVKDRWPYWYLYIFLLLSLAIMEMMAFDLINFMLHMLLIVMACLLVRNDFLLASSLVTPNAILCLINLIFGLMNLIMSLNGRTSIHNGISHAELRPGVERVQVTKTFRTHSFFDGDQGFIYNVQSSCMVIAPISFALGTCLSLMAKADFQELEERELGGLGPRGQLFDFGLGGLQGFGSGRDQPQAPRVPGAAASFTAFAGTGNRLGDDEPQCDNSLPSSQRIYA